jgi:HEAT repeat protein
MDKRLGFLFALLLAATPLIGQEDAGRVIEFESLRLRAENPFTRAQASDTLRKLANDKANAPHLRETLRARKHLLDDPRPIVRWNIAVAIIRVGDMPEAEDAYRVFERDVRDTLYSTSIGAVEMLGELRTERSREILRAAAASSPDDDVRDAAQGALAPRNEGFGGDGDGFDFAPSRRNDDNATTAERERSPAERLAQARFAVENLPSSSALATLADLTRYRGGFVLENERTTWSELVGPVALRLMRFLRQENPPSPMDVRNAARIIGVGGDAVTPTLIAALEDPLPHVREAAAFALLVSVTTAEGRPVDPVPPDVPGAVVFSLADESPKVRRYAAVLLGRTGATDYRRDLTMALSDPDRRVRVAAGRALMELGESPERTQAMAALRTALRETPEGQKADILEALGETLGADELRAFVRSDSPQLAYAAAALLAERENAELWQLVADTGGDDRPWVREAVQRAVAGRFASDNPWMEAFVGLNTPPDADATPAAQTALVVAGKGWEYFADTSVEMPVVGAVVRVNGDAEHPLRTDALGRFVLPTTANEGYDIHVEAEGYVPLDVYRSAGERGQPLTIRLHRD